MDLGICVADVVTAVTALTRHGSPGRNEGRDVAQGLKPTLLGTLSGTAEAVPFQIIDSLRGVLAFLVAQAGYAELGAGEEDEAGDVSPEEQPN